MKTPSATAVDAPAGLHERFAAVRKWTEALAAPLAPEDCVIQSMPDVSPTRWHLAHTTWFFETFVLGRALPGYNPYDAAFAYLFNSYYNLVGDQFPRERRGLLSRPTVAEVLGYRRSVDERLYTALKCGEIAAGFHPIVELGLQHEQQHQELILTDIKHVLSCNPLFPVYRERSAAAGTTTPARWRRFEGGLHSIGCDGDAFCFDNEQPRHRVYLEPFELQSRLVTNAEYIAFIDDRGYERPELWLSLGWQQVRSNGWTAPLYWTKDERWRHFTLSGLQAVDPGAPVCHVSCFEADAFARWAGARLPTEAEWEIAAADLPLEGNFIESGRLHPAACVESDGVRQLFGDVWEWTSSSYSPYPGYEPAPGALGEYNGKFMCNQYVLRGGSCATPRSHVRATYRNFFPPEARWQFTGIRLAR